MRKIDLKEQHELLLDLAEIFSRICKKHNIPYYMLGGTMLGAVRHKGFIPWDDDMDFGVPRNYYDLLLGILEEELPSYYKCCTFENSKNVIYPFCKIEDRRTISLNQQYLGNQNEYLGLNIDVFPLDYCNRYNSKIKFIIRLNDIYGRIFTGSASGSKYKGLLKKIIRLLFPIPQKYFYYFIVNQMKSIPSGDYLANILGHWEKKEIIPMSWYGDSTYYDFENLKLKGLRDYDKYLHQLYGDYMLLPPIEKRSCHSSNIFIK